MSETGLSIRPAGPEDADQIGELFYRCDLHYWGDKAPSRDAMLEHVRDRVLAEGSTTEILLAEQEGKAVGFASFSILYPAPDLGGALYLKDLFTLSEARGKGLGEALMQALAQTAVARGCCRFDWTAEDHNPRAMAFYERIGAQRVTEKVYYRFDGERLREFAEKSGR